jgi:integrase
MDREMRLRPVALLLTLYNTGARISEVLALRQHHLAFGATSLLHLKGKGRKERSVPFLFPSARRGPLSTDRATYILQQAVQRALPACPTLQAKGGFLPTSFATPRRCTFFNPVSKSQ